MAKYISKTFRDSEEAEAYLDGLYEKYDSVKLIRSPTFHPAGAGLYQWEVKEHKGE